MCKLVENAYVMWILLLQWAEYDFDKADINVNELIDLASKHRVFIPEAGTE